MRWHEWLNPPQCGRSHRLWRGSNQRTWGTTALFPSLWPCWPSFLPCREELCHCHQLHWGCGLAFLRLKELVMALKFPLFKTEIFSPNAISYYCKRLKATLSNKTMVSGFIQRRHRLKSTKVVKKKFSPMFCLVGWGVKVHTQKVGDFESVPFTALGMSLTLSDLFCADWSLQVSFFW